jgi:hypothetical protein
MENRNPSIEGFREQENFNTYFDRDTVFCATERAARTPYTDAGWKKNAREITA